MVHVTDMKTMGGAVLVDRIKASMTHCRVGMKVNHRLVAQDA